MRSLLLFAASVICSLSARAEFEVHPAKTGQLVLYSGNGGYFTLLINSSKIKRLEASDPSQLYFLVDGHFLLINPDSFKEFSGNAKAGDEENLRKYFQASSDLYKQPLADFHIEKAQLPNGRVAFTADFTSPSNGSDARRQIMLVFRCGDGVLELGSVLSGADTRASVLEFLNKIAGTLVFSQQPIEIEKLPGGLYRSRLP